MSHDDDVLRGRQPFIWRVAWRFLRNREDALDVTQEVLMRLHRALPSLPSGTNLDAWLYRVTANLSANVIRDGARRRGRHEEAALLRPVTVDPEGSPGLGEAVARAIRELPAQQRGVVTLRLIEQRTFAEIAGIFGVTEGTVKVQFTRAMKRLRDRLGDWK